MKHARKLPTQEPRKAKKSGSGIHQPARRTVEDQFLKNVRFVVDNRGRKAGVFIGIKDYRRILEELEELDDIRAYEEAKAEGARVIPFEQAVAEIERAAR